MSGNNYLPLLPKTRRKRLSELVAEFLLLCYMKA
jgi:hypothetical protein